MKPLYLFFLFTFLYNSPQLINAADLSYSVACPACHRHFPRRSRFPHQGCSEVPSYSDQKTFSAPTSETFDQEPEPELPSTSRRSAVERAMQAPLDRDSDSKMQDNDGNEEMYQLYISWRRHAGLGYYEAYGHCPFTHAASSCTATFLVQNTSQQQAFDQAIAIFLQHLQQVHGERLIVHQKLLIKSR